MTTFGESGPYKDVYEHFGITPERIAEAGRSVTEQAATARR
jgi:transketolase